MSGVVVTKSLPVVIRPSEPADSSSNIINLSSVDQCQASLPVTTLLVFEHAIDDPVETIKRALSQALVHYGPIAGRLTEDGNGIVCTDEGVTFVGASASCALLPTLPPTSDLALHYPDKLCSHSEPLLLMQVTKFSCGGFTVAATWNHAVADGKGMAQFLQAVGELARGMPGPSVLPVRSSDKVSLPVVPASTVAMHRASMHLAANDMAAQDVTVPWSLICRIKAEIPGCTVFEAVAAVVWVCRTRAAISDHEAVASLFFTCNVRKYMGTKGGYYGNCMTLASAHATAGSVANGEIRDVVNLIKEAKEKALHTSNGNGESERERPTVDQTSDVHVQPEKAEIASNEGERGPTVGDQESVIPVQPQKAAAIKDLLYNVLTVATWRNLGFEDADFGRGTPSRVMCHAENVIGQCCIACPPCKGKDGVNVMSFCVRPEHVDAFLAELASMSLRI